MWLKTFFDTLPYFTLKPILAVLFSRYYISLFNLQSGLPMFLAFSSEVSKRGSTRFPHVIRWCQMVVSCLPMPAELTGWQIVWGFRPHFFQTAKVATKSGREESLQRFRVFFGGFRGFQIPRWHGLKSSQDADFDCSEQCWARLSEKVCSCLGFQTRCINKVAIQDVEARSYETNLRYALCQGCQVGSW